MSGQPLVRQPKQQRSRQSFDRVIDTAVALLVERPGVAFTLAEVAAASGVSTGSIYGRVASKESLLRVAHSREMARIADETRQAFCDPGAPDDPGRAVRFAVQALASLLGRNAPVLRPFMLLGHRDPVIAAAGATAHAQMQAEFVDFLAARHGPDRTARAPELLWACTVAYSVLARQIGLDSAPDAAADYDLATVVDRLTDMLTAYLAGRIAEGDAPHHQMELPF